MIAKKRAYIKQPELNKEDLEIYKNFHKKVEMKYHPVDSQPQPYSHYFRPKYFKERKALNGTFDKTKK